MRGLKPPRSFWRSRSTSPAKAGTAVARLLTHWGEEVVGPEIAAHARPVKISHGKNLGATLTLLVAGARAPMIEMQAPRIRERVNACYRRMRWRGSCGPDRAHRLCPRARPRLPQAPGAGRHRPTRRKLPRPTVSPRDFDHPALSAAMRQLALNILSRRDINDRKANS